MAQQLAWLRKYHHHSHSWRGPTFDRSPQPSDSCNHDSSVSFLMLAAKTIAPLPTKRVAIARPRTELYVFKPKWTFIVIIFVPYLYLYWMKYKFHGMKRRYSAFAATYYFREKSTGITIYMLTGCFLNVAGFQAGMALMTRTASALSSGEGPRTTLTEDIAPFFCITHLT